MNLLTQVVCVSGVNKLTSVRDEHVLDHQTLADQQHFTRRLLPFPPVWSSRFGRLLACASVYGTLGATGIIPSSLELGWCLPVRWRTRPRAALW